MAEPVTPDPRALLDAYGQTTAVSVREFAWEREQCAPATFAALRTVLTLIEEWRADGPDDSAIHILMERVEEKIAAALTTP